jgi:hypothetical protein
MFNVSKVKEEIGLWFCWCVSTNRTYALDLYLVFASRTHFKKNEGELVDFTNLKNVQLSRSLPLGSDGAPKE